METVHILQNNQSSSCCLSETFAYSEQPQEGLVELVSQMNQLAFWNAVSPLVWH